MSSLLTLPGLTAASILILIRSAFRVAELKDGFESDIANNEALLMVFEGAMLVLACLALTIGHPGLGLPISWKI